MNFQLLAVFFEIQMVVMATRVISQTVTNHWTMYEI